MDLLNDLRMAAAGLVACTGFILWWTLRGQRPGAGLLLGYWLQFLLNYGIAGVMHDRCFISNSVESDVVVEPEFLLAPAA